MLNIILFEIALHRGNIRLDNKSDNTSELMATNVEQKNQFIRSFRTQKYGRRADETMAAGNAYLLHGAIDRCVCVPHILSAQQTLL